MEEAVEANSEAVEEKSIEKANLTVELGEFGSKQVSLLLPVTVISGLVLVLPSAEVFWSEAAGWTRKTIWVPCLI